MNTTRSIALLTLLSTPLPLACGSDVARPEPQVQMRSNTEASGQQGGGAASHNGVAADQAIPPVSEQPWSVSTAVYEGSPLIVRTNTAARNYGSKARFPLKIAFALPLSRPNPTGLPDPTENLQLQDLEERLASRVLAASDGFHAMTLTTGRMKEFVFFVSASVDVASLHAAVRAEIVTHDVQCTSALEPNWASFMVVSP